MARFWQKKMSLDELMQPGWWDAADYIRERDIRYRMATLNVPVVVKLHAGKLVAAPAPITFGEQCRLLISSPDNRKRRKGHLPHEVVI